MVYKQMDSITASASIDKHEGNQTYRCTYDKNNMTNTTKDKPTDPFSYRFFFF